MISKLIDNLWRPRRNKHHRRLKRASAPIVATEKLEDRTLLSGQDLVAFAQALTAANVELYGAAWDADTTAQKSLLQDGAQFLQFIELTDSNRELNGNAATIGMTDVANLRPIWRLNDGTLIEGNLITNVQELSTATGVAIPTSDSPFLKEISDQNLLSNTGLHVALDGYDPENGELTYSVHSSNTNITARILNNNRSLRISVEGYGDMVFELFEGRVPLATERMIELAESGFYDDLLIHLIGDSSIQGGERPDTGGSPNYFDDQFHAELQHVQTGLLSFAKSTLSVPGDPRILVTDDINDTEFFVTEGANRGLDFHNTIFGFLVEGEEVREAISNIAVTDKVPNFTISMESVDVFTDNENATLFLNAAEGYSGTSTITVTVTNQNGQTQQRQFLLNIAPDTIPSGSPNPEFNPANANPFLNEIPDLRVRIGESILYQLEATDIDLGAENGNFYFNYYDDLALTTRGLPIPFEADPDLNYSVNIITGQLSINPEASMVPGEYLITVAVGFQNSSSPLDPESEDFRDLTDYQIIRVFVTDPLVVNDAFYALQGDIPEPIFIAEGQTLNDGSSIIDNETGKLLDGYVYEVVTQPEHSGTFTFDDEGKAQFVSNGSGYMGLDQFTYRIKDNLGDYSNVATINFSIAPEGVILVTDLGDLELTDGKVTLREAIAAANNDQAVDIAPAGNGHDIIMFDQTLNFSQILTILDPFEITDSLTIIAPTSAEGTPLLTIDTQQRSRHFTINDNQATTLQVSLQNMKLINGSENDNGGSIFNSEFLVITNSELQNNQSLSGLGGAIYNTGTLNISNSLIQNNKSFLTSGGAITSISGPVSLTQTTLDANETEGFGGGLHAVNSDIILTDSVFSNNVTAMGSGGGLYLNGGQLDVINSSFINNKTQDPASSGGGIYATNATTTTISGSTFHKNESSSGGGLFQDNGALSVRNSTFSENTALLGDGGGIFNATITSSVVNSTFSGNSAVNNGGGIYFGNPTVPLNNTFSAIINNSTIANNTAIMLGGGGIYSTFNEITVNNTIIADNSALDSGADVLGYVNGRYSLIENTDGLQTNNVGGMVNFITGQDPGLLPLNDYGSLTKTHALATNSIAIDAGDPAFDPSSFTPELAQDQRGASRIADGNNDLTIQIDIGAYEAESVLGSADLTVKWRETNVGSTGVVNSLPTNADFIDEWNPVIVEIWVSITNSTENGLTSASVDFLFDAEYLTANLIEYGPGFTQNQTGTIDNEAGTITGLGASTILSSYGAESLVLLARVELSVNPIALNADGQHIHPVANLDFEITNSALTTSVGSASVSEGAATNLTLVPALYDLNDNGVIEFRDLILFASAFSKSTGDSEAPHVWAADFDRSGIVDFRDLILFATNYGKVQGSGSLFSYPANFSDVWQQNNLVTSLFNLEDPTTPNLSNQNVEPVLDAAKQQLAEVHGDSVYEELADVEVKVVELPGTQLGKADTETNTIYLDINAAGWGWFVDSTPMLNEEFNDSTSGIFAASLFSTAEGKIDLLSVLIHELNHLLGFDHEHNGDPSREPVLSPGVRIQVADEKIQETDAFFGHYLDPEFEVII